MTSKPWSRRIVGGIMVALMIWAAGTYLGGRDRARDEDEDLVRIQQLSGELELAMNVYRTQGCIGCHSLDGRPSVGSTWLGLWESERELETGETVMADADYLRESIVEPNAKIVKGYPPIMPSYVYLTDEEIDALIALIEHLASEKSE